MAYITVEWSSSTFIYEQKYNHNKLQNVVIFPPPKKLTDIQKKDRNKLIINFVYNDIKQK